MSVDKDLLKISSGEDGELVSCHKCQKIPEKNDKNELCLKRCHLFCPVCIKSFMTSSDAENDFVCPLCKLTESMVDVLNNHSVEHKHQIDQINAACDHALTYCHQIQAAHQVIIAWVGWLLNQINEWDSSNNATIAQLKSFKVLEGFPVKQEKNPQCTINKINELIVQLKDKYKEVQACQLKVSQQFHTYCHCRGSDELTFSTSQTNENESCISALAFLISFLGQSESEKKSEHVSHDVADEPEIRQVGKDEDYVLNRAQLEADLELLAKQFEQAKQSEVNAKQQALNQMERANKAEQMVQSHQSKMEKLRCDYESLEKKFLQKQMEVEKMKEDQEKITAQIMEMNTEFVTIRTKLTEKARLAKEETEQLKLKLAAREKEKRFEQEQMVKGMNKLKEDLLVLLKADLELLTKQLEQAKESEVDAKQQALIQMKRANKAEQMVQNHRSEMEKLRWEKELFEKRLEQEKIPEMNKIKEDLIALLEAEFKLTFKKAMSEEVEPILLSQKAEIEKLRHEKELFEKRLKKEQIEVENMKEVREKITQVMRTNTEFMKAQTKLTEEVRVAKKETEQLKSKLADIKRLEQEQMLEMNKIKEAQEKKSQKLPQCPVAESYTLPTKKIKLREPTEKLQRISTENVLCKVDCGVQEKVTNLQKPQDCNLTNWQQPGSCNAGEKEQCVLLIGDCETKDGSIINENGRGLFVFNNVLNFREILLHLVQKEDIAMSKLFSCMNCKKQISKKKFFYCLICDNYQLCSSCAHVKHEHKIQIFRFKERCNQNNKIKVPIWVTSFLHSIKCLNKECVFPSCENLKRSFDHKHIHNCVTCEKSPNTKCFICKQLVTILFYHAKSCTNLYCCVPYCGTRFVRQLINNPLNPSPRNLMQLGNFEH